MLRTRSRAALVAAELLSTTGAHAAFLALPWFVLAQTGSPAKAGYALAVELAPVVLLGIPSRTVVDALGARRTLLFADAARALLIGLVPALHWSHRLDLPHLLALMLALGIFTAPHVAARRALSARGLGIPAVVGPVAGGLLVAAVGAPWALLAVAGAYLAAALVVVVFVAATESLPPRQPLGRLPVALAPALVAVGAAVNALLLAQPLLAYRRFDRDPHVAGLLLACFGVGTLLGAPLALRALRRVAPMRLARGALFAVVSPLWLLALDLPWAGTAVLLLLVGLLVPFVTTVFGSAVAALGAPLGLVAVGLLLEHGSVATTYTVVAATTSVAALVVAAVAQSAREVVPVHSPAWH